jgi:methionyl-tRNA formyltransferase
VHPSLLPRHRGATPIPAAILAGDERTGVAIQKVAKELDAGDLLLVRETPIRAGETAGELGARLAAWSGELVLEALELVDSGRARYAATGSLARDPLQEAREGARPPRLVEAGARARTPRARDESVAGSGDETAERHGSLRVACGARGWSAGAPGAILEASKRLLVATGDRALELTEVQLPGKRPLPAADFLRGARLEPGVVLGAAPAR